MFGLVSWVAMGLLGFYGFAGFLVGTWWVLFCFIYLFFLGFWFWWDFVGPKVVVAGARG